MQKISLTHQIRDDAGVSLAVAKQMVDDVLDGQSAVTELPPDRDPQAVALRWTELGAVCVVQEARS